MRTPNDRNDDDARFQDESARLNQPIPPGDVPKLIKAEYRYAKFGLVAGIIILLLGATLIVLGYSGTVDITFSSGSTSGHLATGSLGVVFALVGGFVIWKTRPDFEAGSGGRSSDSRRKS